MSERESGWYWVRTDNDWFIAEWDAEGENWFTPGDNIKWADNVFTQIDERRIVRTEPEVTK